MLLYPSTEACITKCHLIKGAFHSNHYNSCTMPKSIPADGNRLTGKHMNLNKMSYYYQSVATVHANTASHVMEVEQLHPALPMESDAATRAKELCNRQHSSTPSSRNQHHFLRPMQR